MKKKELKTGMIVELRNASRYLVLKETSHGNMFVNMKNSKLCKAFSDYKADLTHGKNKLFDIVAVYNTPNSMCFLNDEKYEELWRRFDDASDRICLVKFPSNESKSYAFMLPKEFTKAREGDKVLVELRRGAKVGVRISKIYPNSTEAFNSDELRGVQLPLCKVVELRTV